MKKLRPTCSWWVFEQLCDFKSLNLSQRCKDYSKYSENVQLRILLENYKKLCGLIKITRMYCEYHKILNHCGSTIHANSLHFIGYYIPVPGHILRNPEQGSIIKDIIAESEGEKIPRYTSCFPNIVHQRNIHIKKDSSSIKFRLSISILSLSPGLSLLKMSDPPRWRRTQLKLRWIRESLTCNILAKVEVKEELEPPDEVLSSPYSILKARPKPAAPPATAAKVS